MPGHSRSEGKQISAHEPSSEQVRDAWERNAEFWDEYMGEGRSFQNLLIGPATEKLLELRSGQVVLDIACGNGAFSRRMAKMGVQVVALDFSRTFLQRARDRTVEHAHSIRYLHIDATDEQQLLALGRERFDSAVCNMGLMDMSTITPLMSALSQLLKPEGCFVFSVLHPCFNSSDGFAKVLEEEDREGELHLLRAIKIWRYISPSVAKGLGLAGQPVPQYYFHRPLSQLLHEGFQTGFLVDGLEEPVFDAPGEQDESLSWASFREIPPVIIIRMRKLSQPR